MDKCLTGMCFFADLNYLKSENQYQTKTGTYLEIYRKMLCKLWAILNNPSHPLHDVLDSHSSAEDSLHYNAPQNTTGHEHF